MVPNIHRTCLKGYPIHMEHAWQGTQYKWNMLNSVSQYTWNMLYRVSQYTWNMLYRVSQYTWNMLNRVSQYTWNMLYSVSQYTWNMLYRVSLYIQRTCFICCPAINKELQWQFSNLLFCEQIWQLTSLLGFPKSRFYLPTFRKNVQSIEEFNFINKIKFSETFSW